MLKQVMTERALTSFTVCVTHIASLDPTMDLTGFAWTGWDDCVLISNHCSTVDAVSFKLQCINLAITVLPRLKVSIAIVSGT